MIISFLAFFLRHTNTVTMMTVAVMNTIANRIPVTPTPTKSDMLLITVPSPPVLCDDGVVETDTVLTNCVADMIGGVATGSV